MSAGKGDRLRKVNQRKYDANYAAIRWGKRCDCDSCRGLDAGLPEGLPKRKTRNSRKSQVSVGGKPVADVLTDMLNEQTDGKALAQKMHDMAMTEMIRKTIQKCSVSLSK